MQIKIAAYIIIENMSAGGQLIINLIGQIKIYACIGYFNLLL